MEIPQAAAQKGVRDRSVLYAKQAISLSEGHGLGKKAGRVAWFKGLTEAVMSQRTAFRSGVVLPYS